MSEHELLVPPVTEENICLPLAVSAVSKYWDVNLPLAEAKEIAKKYQNVRGSILIEGIELAERHGLSSLILHSSLRDLKKVIDMGIPPIVILPGLYEVVQHASVISGYDQKENSIIHYMPQPDQIGMIPQKQFDDLWEEDGRLAILVAPADIISAIKVENKNKEKSNRLCFVSEKLNLQGKADDAIKTLKEAIALDGTNSTALCLLGGIYNERNSPECIQYYEQSLTHNKRCYLAYRGLGNYYLKTRQFEKAESYYTNAIKINPTRFGPIYKNRGIARLELKKNKEARQDFESYLKHTPGAKDRAQILQAIKEL
ncbi:MAG: tetratricopeptide repeat protein [Candidatus Nitrosotenuis sp.]